MIVKRGISSEQAQLFAQRNKMFYMEVSAKTGYNVEEAFYKMAYEVHQSSIRMSMSSSKSGRGGVGDSSDSTNVMQDRVKLRPSGGKGEKDYAEANEVPTGMHDTKKKKCC